MAQVETVHAQCESGGGGGSSTATLDAYSDAAAVYSVRRVYSTYAGSAIEVRRASDNQTQDIGFDTDGTLDTDALSTFCSGTDCYVATWYDQSGNGKDASQSTASKQPQIYDSADGVVLENDRPALLFDGGDHLESANVVSGTTARSFFSVHKLEAGSRGVLYSANSAYQQTGACYLWHASSQFGIYLSGAGRNLVPYTPGVQYIGFHSLASGSNISNGAVLVNGMSNNSTTKNGFPNTASSTAVIGNSAYNVAWQGTQQELIIYLSDETSNREAIEENINDYFRVIPNFDEDVPFQNNPYLLNPVVTAPPTNNGNGNPAVHMTTFESQLLEMIRALEDLLAANLGEDVVRGDYATYSENGGVISMLYEPLNLRAAVLNLQLELNELLTATVVNTDSVADIAQQYAKLMGSVSFNVRPLQDWGFIFDTDSTFATADTLDVPFTPAQVTEFATSESDTGSFYLDKTGLTRYTQYFVKAYATDCEELTVDENVQSFYTLPDPPSGLTLDTLDVTSSSAVLKLSIADAGGQGPDEVTFYYDTLDFTTHTAVIDSLTSDSTGGTEHSVSLTGLSRYTDYYFNAFAENLAGDVGADANMVFKTLPELATFDTVYFDASIDSLVAILSDNGGQVPTALQFSIDTEATLASAVATAATLIGDTFKALYAGEPGSTYHGHASATNLAGTAHSDTITWSTLAAVTTNERVEEKTDSTGTLQASFVYGNAVPTAVGFQWGLGADLSDATSNEVTMGADSTIQLALTGLQKDSTYYFTSYATNAGGTAYGDTLSFVARTFECEPPTFDGYDYDVVAIGNQCWFAENLRTAVYNNGDSIPGGLGDAAWAATTEGAQAIYEEGGPDEAQNLSDYGRLYNWYATQDGRGLCPTGWHVPTNDEFTVLVNFLGGDAAAGEQLKSSATDTPSWNGTNSSGWSALPGGTRADIGLFGTKGSTGSWWFAPYIRSMNDSGLTPAGVASGEENRGYSARCLRDSSSAPVAVTTQVEALNADSAIVQGTVAFNWEPMTATGFKWGYASDLSDGTEVTADSLDGDFSAAFGGLTAETTVYYAAFATNYLGTTYGDTLTFTTKTGLTDLNIHDAVDAWCADSTSAEVTYGHISDWNVSAVTDMAQLFKEKSNFNSDISDWDVSAVTNALEMFWQASAFNQDLSAWDVSSLSIMQSMFFMATSFTSDLSQWDVSSATSMYGTFQRATAFDSDLSQWNVSGVTNMKGMFNDCTNFNSDLSDWDVSSVTTMQTMFYQAENFNQDLNTWDVSSLQDAGWMFGGTTNFNGNISDWDVSSVTAMDIMFSGATSFDQDLSNWDVSSVRNMNQMFYGSVFNQDLSNWNTASVTRMSSMFGNSIFNQDIGGWDVGSVTDISLMFSGNETFNQDIGGWNISSVTKMRGMFAGASSFNQDLNDWNVGSVSAFNDLFRDATSFNGDISAWNVSSATDMGSAFESCIAFEGDLSAWQVGAVTNTYRMFYGATSFNADIGAWDLSSVTNLQDMFNEASSFNQDVSAWDLSAATNTAQMFRAATSFDQDVSGWDVSSVQSFHMMFNGASAFNQDLSDWDISAATGMNYFASGAGFSDAHYDAMLNAWSSLPLKSNVQFGINAGYCYGAGARQAIIDAFNWTIADGSVCSPVPSTSTDAASNVNQTSADVEGSFSNMSTVSDAGFHVSADSTLAGAINQSAGTTSPFTLSLTGLAPNTVYYYRAYATDELGTAQGSIESFQTQGPPVVSTVAETAWTDTTAALTGFSDADALPAVTATGFKWGSQSDLSDAADVTGNALTDTFTYALTASGPLYYAAYATNAIGTTYGDTIQLVGEPAVTTSEATQVTDTEAKLNAALSTARRTVTATGFKWSYQADLSNATTVSGDALLSEFSADLSGLVTNDSVYFAAFATSDLGTTYGDTVSFEVKLGPCQNEASFTFDGYDYDLVEIGDQCWFAENLRTTSYNNGDAIPSGLDNAAWSAATGGAVTVQDEGGANEAQNLSDYGRLYNFYAVNDSRGLCPTGWHVPLDSEWTELTDAILDPATAGDALKSSATDTPPWVGSTGTNSTGFSALPGGKRTQLGTFHTNNYGAYWASGSVTWARTFGGSWADIDRDTEFGRSGLSVRCLRDEPGVPAVATAAASSVTDSSATLNGSVGFNWEAITAAGFKWGYAADLSDGIEVSGDVLVGEFTADMTELVTNNTLYYVSYATNALGTTYGDTLSFEVRIPACGDLTSVTFDGYDYDLVSIGDQCWFAENLRNDNYADGSLIPGGLDISTWDSTTEHAQAIYNWDSVTYYADYGRLYNWYAVNNAAGLCPTGWHVPTDGEWKTLEMELGMSESEAEGSGFRGTDQGTQMKSLPSDSPSWDGTNESGWSGLPGGDRGNSGYFSNAGNSTYWWSSTEETVNTAWIRHLISGNSSVFRNYKSQENGFSVRCIKNDPGAPIVTTLDASDATETTATLNASVYANGEAITSRGFEWGYAADLSDGTEVSGDALSCEGSTTLTNLTTSATVFHVAFATNVYGTTYGDTLSFTVETPPACGNLTTLSYDGYDYDLVSIEGQCWFAENLRSDQYADGSPIPGDLDFSAWNATLQGAQAIYNGDSAAYYADFGRLYNWYAAVDSRGLCPSGWHVATYGEYTNWFSTLGSKFAIGEYLKSSPSDVPAWDGTNSTGFSALPGGERGSTGYWYGTIKGIWLTPDTAQDGSTLYVGLDTGSNTFQNYTGGSRHMGRSVRCVKDVLSEDMTQPTMTITSQTVNNGDTTDDTTLVLTFTSSEATSDFTADDISVTNGAISNFSGSNASYTAHFTPAGEGPCEIQVEGCQFTDESGNGNTSSNAFSWNYTANCGCSISDYSDPFGCQLFGGTWTNCD